MVALCVSDTGIGGLRIHKCIVFCLFVLFLNSTLGWLLVHPCIFPSSIKKIFFLYLKDKRYNWKDRQILKCDS